MAENVAYARSIAAETMQIGPLVATVVTPPGRRGEWIRVHYSSHTADVERPELELRILADREPMDDSVKAAKGEVIVSTTGATIPSVAAGWRLTPRSAARAAKWALEPGAWQRSRRQLLLRHGFEHPLMSVLDLRHAYFSIHAAAVARDELSVLILGANGAGKTTAALQLTHGHGWELMADNFVATDGVDAVGFPGAPRVKRGAAPQGSGRRHLTANSRRLAGILWCDEEEGGAQMLASKCAESALRAYIEHEREDHRDSAVFELIGAAIGIAPQSCGHSVIERLARIPVVRWNWRDTTVVAAMGMLGL